MLQPFQLASDDDGAKPVVRSASLIDAANLLLTNFTLPITAAVSPSRHSSHAFTGGNQSPSKVAIGGMNAFVAIPNYPINDEHRTLLDTLADIASMKSPVKKRVHIDDSSISYPSRNQSLSISRHGSNEIDNAMEGRIGRRPRAMSEPWVIDDSWVKTLQEAHHVVTMSKSGNTDDGAFLGINSENNILTNNVNQTHPSAPQILNKYTASRYVTFSCHLSFLYSFMFTHLRSYNKNGRIGIYTREERNIIIQKFYEKRKRRVWKKKIRYHCRKNLADRRVRIKGRFVKGGVDAANNAASTVPNETKDAEEDEEEEEEEDDEAVQTSVNVNVIAVKSPNISRQNSISSAVGVSQVMLPSSLVSNSSEPPAKRVRRHSIAY